MAYAARRNCFTLVNSVILNLVDYYCYKSNLLSTMQYAFDLDQTLLDHPHAVKGGLSTLTQARPECCILSTEDLFTEWITAEHRHFTRFEKGEIGYQEQRRERLREVFPDYCAAMNDADLDALYQVYTQGYQDSWRLYDDVLPALEVLGHKPMALITNGSSELQRAKIKKLGIEDRFESILISGEFGAHKPDRTIFLRACKDLGLAPEEVTYIGDNFRNDVAGSHGAGLHAVWLNRESLPRPETSILYEEIHTLSDM